MKNWLVLLQFLVDSMIMVVRPPKQKQRSIQVPLNHLKKIMMIVLSLKILFERLKQSRASLLTERQLSQSMHNLSVIVLNSHNLRGELLEPIRGRIHVNLWPDEDGGTVSYYPPIKVDEADLDRIVSL